MPPLLQQLPRFIAGSSEEGLPYGRWAQQLRESFVAACAEHESIAGGPPEEVIWFPERTWGGRVWIPATARAKVAEGAPPAEYFGHVSFARPAEGEPGDLRAVADSTDVVAEQNDDWQIDVNEDVIGRWNGEGDRGGDVTLVWGTPLLRGALAATAELDNDVADQAPVTEERFTLVAVDALADRGETIYLDIKLWGRKGVELAAESLYEADEDDSAAPASSGTSSGT